MISHEDLRKILELAVLAPSGENCQPWRLGVRDNKIYIFNVPERDRSPYNILQRGSLVAHGTLIENALTASSALGYKTKLDLFPNKRDQNLVAVITLENSSSKNEPLYDYIATRTTNRKPYKATPLTREQSNEIIASGEEVGGGKVLLEEEPKNIKTLSLVGSMNERIVFENPILHNFLFTHITWTKKEDQEKKAGFYIKTLELGGPGELGFKIFKFWPIVNFFNKIGLSEIVWKQNGKTYAASSAIGIVAVNANRNEDFIAAGRITQRIWLKATKMGLSFQPLTGVLFFMQGILSGATKNFTSSQIQLINGSYEKVKKIFGIHNETIPMMFRIGYGGEPTARSSRFQLDDLLIKDF